MQETSVTIERHIPAREEIAKRAYKIYWERGCQPGHEFDDWLQAEYELMQLPIQDIATMPTKGSGRKSAIVNLVHAAMFLAASSLTQFKT